MASIRSRCRPLALALAHAVANPNSRGWHAPARSMATQMLLSPRATHDPLPQIWMRVRPQRAHLLRKDKLIPPQMDGRSANGPPVRHSPVRNALIGCGPSNVCRGRLRVAGNGPNLSATAYRVTADLLWVMRNDSVSTNGAHASRPRQEGLGQRQSNLSMWDSKAVVMSYTVSGVGLIGNLSALNRSIGPSFWWSEWANAHAVRLQVL